MAGVRHHTIPRFLLKGFASKSVGQETFTWVFRKEGNVFETNTKNIGVEKHFYGKSGELNVDDEITEIEGKFATLLDTLRKEKDGYKILDAEIVNFVGHLSSRTKHLRDSFLETTGLLSDAIFGYLANEDKRRNWLLAYYKKHPEVLEKNIDETVAKLASSRNERKLLKKRLKATIRPEHIVSIINKEAGGNSIFDSIVNSITEKLPNMLKESHIKTLAKSLIPEPRVEMYKKLNWFVCKSDQPLILGDMGCLFEVDGKKQFLLLAGKDDNLKNIYLPISTGSLVLGTSSTEMPKIDFALINENISRNSRDFFISNNDSSEFRKLLDEIGKDSELLSEEEINKILQETIKEL